ncbi:hypothetical protein ACHAXR_010172 [Thalassiosira sp. AJA248-18]
MNMFHYTNNPNNTSSRRLSSNDRLMNDGGVYFSQYDGGSAGDGSDAVPSSRGGSSHARSASEFSYSSHHPALRQSYPVMELEDEEGDEAMEILYEDQLPHHHHVRRHHSEPAISSSTASGDIELQLSTAADHLLALLQREANDYSVPLPVRYYPTEFAEVDSSPTEGGDGGTADKSTKKTTIGPWRKRIASWMYDVVDHFQYDRNVVSIALRYIDQYVGHLLVENAKNGRSTSSSGQPIKRRHFQLIAVTSLYLAIKVHGELMEDDPVSGADYDVVASLVDEVDGRLFLGKPLSNNEIAVEEEEETDTSSQESDEDLRAVSHKITDLKRRQRKGRWNMGRLSQFGLPIGHPNGSGGVGSSANYANSDLSSSTRSSSAPKIPKMAHSALPYKPRKRGMLSGPLRLVSFVELSRGLFTSSDITETEKKILVALNYVVNPPTSRRFVGELLRLLALAYCSSVDGRSTNTGATAIAAERILGLERKEILQNVLDSACKQIEGAASVPALSIGCLPSVLAYGAVLNAVEEEFDKIAADNANSSGVGSDRMEMEKDVGSSPQLEDFQRHYRRYSRNTSPSPASSAAAPTNLESDKELFLEAWKEQFLVTVFHATNCFLSPDSQDIFNVRELLLDQLVKDDKESAAAGSPSSAASPTETSKLSQDGLKKRSPRSPRSVVIGPSPRTMRGASFFRQGSSSRSSFSSLQGSSLLSPYDARGRTASTSSIGSIGENKTVSFRSSSNGHSVPHHRAYYKQTSEPIAEANATTTSMAASRFARAQTPDMASSFRNELSRQRVGSNYEGSWRSTGEAFQPPNPNPPFFSA